MLGLTRTEHMHDSVHKTSRLVALPGKYTSSCTRLSPAFIWSYISSRIFEQVFALYFIAYFTSYKRKRLNYYSLFLPARSNIKTRLFLYGGPFVSMTILNHVYWTFANLVWIVSIKHGINIVKKNIDIERTNSKIYIHFRKEF